MNTEPIGSGAFLNAPVYHELLELTLITVLDIDYMHNKTVWAPNYEDTLLELILQAVMT